MQVVTRIVHFFCILAIVFSAGAGPLEAQEQSSAILSAREDATPCVTLAQAVVCQKVQDRRPVGSGDVFFNEVGNLYCFIRAVGAQTPTRLTHNWYYQGVLKASVRLAIKSADYRTWSSKTIPPDCTGEWMVEILCDDGTPLESIIFFVR